MLDWEDYYKILQVDFLAEPEIIGGAYKRLAMKYHPDINRRSAAIEVMTKINVAYETLIDINKRNQYNIRWVERQGYNDTTNYRTISRIDEIFASKAKEVLNTYFSCILNKDYSEAYDYISENDKKYISLNQFIKWQDTVAKVFQLSFFECETLKCYKRKILKETSFDEVIEFNVKVIEKNLVMGRIEEDKFTKQTVIENNKWSVFIGYQELSPLIDKFEKLSDLSGRKKRILLSFNNNKDSITGFLNRKGFLEKASFEIERYKRYGNIFAVILCRITYEEELDIQRLVLKKVSQIIGESIRVIDIPSRWNNETFVLILPETNAQSTSIVIGKIKSNFKKESLVKDKSFSSQFIGFENNFEDLDELIKYINNCN